MYIKILALISLLSFASFLYVIAAQVKNAPALITVLAIVVLMAAYDFWRDLFGRKNKPK